ncbi:hypothetical protein DAEQUDRAFT_731911 [Daedalea quercina L-15889]|uniref:Uncharacterized protein n=1 Tax=Daedalea quercina L-15889 TaxID=1314783 RepID=A0A165LZK8_9APHY|nr:hypothetical protein DAEQUDRAFT_731911 [Daedalea quercina L-15889]
MGWPIKLSTLALLALDSLLARTVNQQPLKAPIAVDDWNPWLSRPWDEQPDKDATSNLIFQSLAGLMQMKANSKHPNGHSIVRASIPPGTALYHGRHKVEYPTRDWIAFDPEHSAIFALGSNGTLLTFITTRELTLLYFDGCSGNKVDGVVDTQDLLFWGRLQHKRQGWWGELERIEDGCTWARQYGIDGFVRMEFDFEIMYCDFSDGLELVSVISPVNGQPPVTHPSRPPPRGTPYTRDNLSQVLSRISPAEATFHGFLRTERPGEVLEQPDGLMMALSPLTPPPGWKGTLPFLGFEAKRSGTWHNDFPGELRVRPEPSTLVSFFDPSLTSLVTARRNMTRNEYAAGNISREDLARLRQDVAEMAARPSGAGSGVDWVGLARVIEERFRDRLPYLQHLLRQPVVNSSAQAAAVRKQLMVSLIPYMHREAIGESEWFANIARDCATRFTAGLPVSRFTKQERLLHCAIDEVLHEICRVYTGAWVDAFDVEAKSMEAATSLLAKWADEFNALIEWLDWPVWIQCHPACEVSEYCYVPQGRPWGLPDDHEPRCLSIEDEIF